MIWISLWLVQIFLDNNPLSWVVCPFCVVCDWLLPAGKLGQLILEAWYASRSTSPTGPWSIQVFLGNNPQSWVVCFFCVPPSRQTRLVHTICKRKCSLEYTRASSLFQSVQKKNDDIIGICCYSAVSTLHTRLTTSNVISVESIVMSQSVHNHDNWQCRFMVWDHWLKGPYPFNYEHQNPCVKCRHSYCVNAWIYYTSSWIG